MAKPTDRIAWVDDARGIGIILVVFGHVIRGLFNAGLADGSGLHFADAWIYSFHMPLFFLLSGLFAERRVERRPRAFLGTQLATIAYPYLVWSVLQSLIQVALIGHTNRRLGLDELAAIPIRPVMQFWFLYALLLISLAYYAMRRLGLGRGAVLLIFAALHLARRALPGPIWTPLANMMDDGVFYALGAALNRDALPSRVGRLPTPTLVAVAVAGFAAVTAAIPLGWQGQPALGAVVALAGIGATVALSSCIGRAGGLAPLRIAGRHSLEIYVAHTIASAGCRIALAQLLHVRDVSTHLLLGTAAGLLLPLMLARFCEDRQATFLFRWPRRPSPAAPPVKATSVA